MLATATRKMLPATCRLLLQRPAPAVLSEQALLLARFFSVNASEHSALRVPSMYASLATDSPSAGMTMGLSSHSVELGSWVSPMSMSMDELASEEDEEDDAEEDDFRELVGLVSQVHGRPDLQLGSALSRLGVKCVRDLEHVTETDLVDCGISFSTAQKFIQVAERAMVP